MLDAEQISSLQNDRIKNLVKLRNRRSRDQQGIFLAEGYRAISRALEKDVVPKEIYFSPDWFLGENETALLEEAQSRGAKLFEISKIAFEKVAYRERPEGLIGVIPQWSYSIKDLRLSKPPFLLIVESIEKPGNLGTILRSADAAGVDDEAGPIGHRFWPRAGSVDRRGPRRPPNETHAGVAVTPGPEPPR